MIAIPSSDCSWYNTLTRVYVKTESDRRTDERTHEDIYIYIYIYICMYICVYIYIHKWTLSGWYLRLLYILLRHKLWFVEKKYARILFFHVSCLSTGRFNISANEICWLLCIVPQLSCIDKTVTAEICFLLQRIGSLFILNTYGRYDVHLTLTTKHTT